MEAMNEILAGVIPRRFHGTSLVSYRRRSRSQEGARDAVAEWLAAVQAGEGPMLALVGDKGVGKSHLLYGAVRALYASRPTDQKKVITSGWRAPFVQPWYRLAHLLRYGDGRDDGPTGAQRIRQKLWDAPIVLIDEVRPTSGTSFDDTELAQFACHAYDNLVAVLITTNVHPLERVMGGPAAGRFTELVMDGPDGREAKAA